jgi:acetate CoA/acetoacetate CoA-transferase beta subunit
MAVFEIAGSRLLLKEIAPGLGPEDLANATEARFETAEDLVTMT